MTRLPKVLKEYLEGLLEKDEKIVKVKLIEENEVELREHNTYPSLYTLYGGGPAYVAPIVEELRKRYGGIIIIHAQGFCALGEEHEIILDFYVKKPRVVIQVYKVIIENSKTKELSHITIIYITEAR